MRRGIESFSLLRAWTLIFLSLGACITTPKISNCDAGVEGAAPDGAVRPPLSIIPASDRAQQDGKTVTIPLVIDANIPCLIGGATAKVTTSVGTVGGAAPGAVAMVFLAPTTVDRYAGRLRGETSLVVDAGASSRVQVSVADLDFISLIMAPGTDAGVAEMDADQDAPGE